MIDPEALREALAARPPQEHPALPGRTNHRRAGVLVPIVWDPAPVAIATLRTQQLSKHPGEVCFPGGRPDPDDRDLFATAAREAREELGIVRARLLGRLSSIPLYTSDFRLEPFVAAVPPAPLVPNPAEVARVLRLPLEAVFAASALDAIPYTLDGVERLSPVFEAEGQRMFGATAHAFLELLEAVAAATGRALPPLRPGRYAWSDVFGGA